MKKLNLAILVIIAAVGISLLTIVFTAQTSTTTTNTSTNTSSTNVSSNSTQNLGGITLQELQKHSTQEDCWVVYKNKAYDVTSWLTRHPGGVQAIAQYCGTTGFEAAFIQQHGTRMASLFLQVAKLMGDFKEVGGM